MFGTFGLAFWYGAKRYSIGAISNSGVVIVVLMSVLMILMSVERVASPLIAVSKATAAACEFFTLIDAPVPLSGTLQPDISSEDLILDNVSFEYPSRPGVKILDALSFVVRNGQNTALVGPSGSGKSTIVGLLEQWYSLTYQHTIPQVVTAGSEAKSESNSEPVQKEEPDGVTTERKSSGAITIGEHNLEELDLKWWRTQIGLVQQEPFLFNDTIFGNVAHGLIGTPWMDKSEPKKRELVQEACREAYAEEFIKRLPNVGPLEHSAGRKDAVD